MLVDDGGLRAGAGRVGDVSREPSLVRVGVRGREGDDSFAGGVEGGAALKGVFVPTFTSTQPSPAVVVAGLGDPDPP